MSAPLLLRQCQDLTQQLERLGFRVQQANGFFMGTFEQTFANVQQCRREHSLTMPDRAGRVLAELLQQRPVRYSIAAGQVSKEFRPAIKGNASVTTFRQHSLQNVDARGLIHHERLRSGHCHQIRTAGHPQLQNTREPQMKLDKSLTWHHLNARCFIESVRGHTLAKLAT